MDGLIVWSLDHLGIIDRVDQEAEHSKLPLMWNEDKARKMYQIAFISLLGKGIPQNDMTRD